MPRVPIALIKHAFQMGDKGKLGACLKNGEAPPQRSGNAGILLRRKRVHQMHCPIFKLLTLSKFCKKNDRWQTVSVPAWDRQTL